MARLTAGRPSGDRWLGFGLVAALVALGLVRIALGGWAPLAADDARYLYVGLSILDGHGPVGPNGTIFLLRSPVYGLALALGSAFGGDPLVGARVVAVALGLLGLAGACRLGWHLAGAGGAVGTAVGLVATPLLWRLVPSLRIDLTQTAAIVAVLLTVWRPTTRRWAIGGMLLGVAILVKETAVPLLLLPVALLGTVPRPRLARLALVFVGAAVVTAAWWWIVVWFSTGQLFPLNALSVIETRDVDVPLRVDRSAIPLLGAIVVGWGLVAWRARHDGGFRLLLVAAAALGPAALYAASRGLNARNFAGLAVLSAIAIGAGGAWLVAALRERRGDRSGDDQPARAARTSRPARALVSIALAGVAVVALAVPVIGQRDVGQLPPDRLADQLAGWLGANVPDGDRIVMAFREREEMALRRFGRGEVALLPIVRVDPAEPPETYLWMGLRDQQLFGYRRTDWTAALTDPPADVLVLVGAHPFTPFELTAGPATAARLGLTSVATFESDGERAEVHRVDAAAAVSGASGVPLHLSAEAAAAWLALDAGDTAAGRLLAARPVVVGGDDAIRMLLDRLGNGACAAPADAGTVRLGPSGSCAD